MDFSPFLICPHCGGPLHREGASLFCDGHTGRRHCYDIASSGYVNLLPPGKGGNAHTGDDGAMITARSAFLGGGYYDCISDAAAEIAWNALSHRRDCLTFCDAGSGEGYHTRRMACRLSEVSSLPTVGCGIDASKKGAAAGAKGCRNLPANVSLSFAAGNIFSLPVAEDSLDIVFSLFGPRHLWELRCLLYDEPREGNAEAATPAGFILSDKQTVRRVVHIPDTAALQALFTMTPFYYRTPESGRMRLLNTPSLDVSIEADIYVFRKELS